MRATWLRRRALDLLPGLSETLMPSSLEKACPHLDQEVVDLLDDDPAFTRPPRKKTHTEAAGHGLEAVTARSCDVPMARRVRFRGKTAAPADPPQGLQTLRFPSARSRSQVREVVPTRAPPFPRSQFPARWRELFVRIKTSFLEGMVLAPERPWPLRPLIARSRPQVREVVPTPTSWTCCYSVATAAVS